MSARKPSAQAENDSVRERLFEEALKVRAHAYAPYSKFLVGAALIDDSGRVFAGCNFENSSYGAAICAERNAIGQMVAGGARSFREIVVVTDTPQGCPPCGMCRQVLAEFAKDLAGAPGRYRVHVANLKGIIHSYDLVQLLPHTFDSSYLK